MLRAWNELMRVGALWAIVALGCATEPAPSPSKSVPLPSATAVSAASSVAPPSKPSCSARIGEIRGEPEVVGTPQLAKHRAAVLARAKGEPVVFLRAPRRVSDPSPEEQYFLNRLERAESKARALRDIYLDIRNMPHIARGVLLREGYVYAETPGLADELALILRLRHLFREPEIVLQRGGTFHRLVREDGDYVYKEGPNEGERASVYLFDRVWVAGEDPGPALHRTLHHVLDQSGADRVRIRRLTERGAIADLRYGSHWIPAVLRHEGADFVLDCESVPPEVSADVERVRRLAFLHQRVLRAQHEVIDAQVRERLPFDEPRTEEGQQDGELRRAWKWAYRHDWTIYHFNEDTYRVFNADGSPRVPQVCIDFVVDTLERTSGSWWLPEGNERVRTKGLDIEALGIDNKRSVERFVNFAWDHPEWFEAYDLRPEERIPFRERKAFFSHLQEHADRYRPGDIVTIFGPRGDENHYHSFFIYRADPITGTPIWVAANAGKPRIRTWASEMRNAPRRSIKTRIRPRVDWLASTLPPSPTQAARATKPKPRG